MQDEPPVTRAEFNQLLAQVKRIEQETEPMRLERRLSIPEANTLQAIMDMVGRHGPDIATIKTDVNKIEKRLDQMATKDDLKAIEKRFDAIKNLQEQILDRLPPKK